MNNSLAKETVNFNDFEKNILKLVCFLDRFLTESILTMDDIKLHKEIKKLYRNKGYAITVIKTIYGEVKYKRLTINCQLFFDKIYKIIIYYKNKHPFGCFYEKENKYIND